MLSSVGTLRKFWGDVDEAGDSRIRFAVNFMRSGFYFMLLHFCEFIYLIK